MALKPEAREKRLAMARRFETSLVSKSEFCRQEKVSVCKLNYWLKNLAIERRQETSEGEFIEVVVSEPETSVSRRVTCEVELPHGVKLRFFGPGE